MAPQKIKSRQAPAGKHISIFVPAGPCILSSIIGTYKILTTVNKILQEQHPGEPLPFRVQLVGLHRETNLYEDAFCIRPHAIIDEITQTDLIILPAINGDPATEIKRNEALIPWVTRHYKQGAEIASLCTGAFLLASTGLMNGKKCATHWMFYERFRGLFPEVELVKSIVQEERGIYSSGGAYSFLNLVLHLVEKYVNHEMAVQCSKIFEIEMNRITQAPFSVFNGHKSHKDDTVIQAQQFMEEHYTGRINVEELASRFLLSRRNFERRFRKATQYSPAEYLTFLKMEAARRKLESSRYPINEVMYAVGYNDTKAFRSTFKKITGLSPLEYRNKFQSYGPSF